MKSIGFIGVTTPVFSPPGWLPTDYAVTRVLNSVWDEVGRLFSVRGQYLLSRNGMDLRCEDI